jgi:ribosomal protein S18 acetylase RimI-like enzyme
MNQPASLPEIPAPRTDSAPVLRVATLAEAHEVAAFLLQPNQFGTPLTPGERDDFQNAPITSIVQQHEIFWYLLNNPHQIIAAALGIRLHANRTGIFQVIAFAVHRTSRHQGLGRRLLNHALCTISDLKGRGLLFDTSAHASYLPIQRLLTAMQFDLVGRFPGFYYPGEDALWYYRALELPYTL